MEYVEDEWVHDNGTKARVIRVCRNGMISRYDEIEGEVNITESQRTLLILSN